VRLWCCGEGGCELAVVAACVVTQECEGGELTRVENSHR
jgi:hypothetical protein